MCNFKGPSMQIWQCPIHHDVLKSFVWSRMIWISLPFFLNLFIFFAGSLGKWLAHCLRIRSNGETCRNKQLPTFLIRLRFKGTVVNRVLPSLHGGSLEITLTVSLGFPSSPKPSQVSEPYFWLNGVMCILYRTEIEREKILEFCTCVHCVLCTLRW